MKKLWLLASALLIAHPAHAGFNYIDAGGNPQAVFSESGETSGNVQASAPEAPVFTPEIAPPAQSGSAKKSKTVNIREKREERAQAPVDDAPSLVPPDDTQIRPIIESVQVSSEPVLPQGDVSVSPMSDIPKITPLAPGQFIGQPVPQVQQTQAPAQPAPQIVQQAPAQPSPQVQAEPVQTGVIIEPSAVPEPVISTTPEQPAEINAKVGNQSVSSSETVARVVMDDGYVIEVPRQSEAERRAYERMMRREGLKAASSDDDDRPAKKAKAEKPKVEKPKTVNPRMKNGGPSAEKPKIEKPAKPAKPKKEPKLVDVPNPPEAFITEKPDQASVVAPAVAPAVSPVSPEETREAPIMEPVSPISEPAIRRESEIRTQDAEDHDPGIQLVPPAHTAAPDFILEKGSLKSQLGAYADRMGYRLEWKHGADLMVANPTVFSKGTFAGNIRELFETLERIGKYGLSAKLFNGDKTLVVE